MIYAIAGIVVLAVGFITFIAVQFKKSGKTAAEVADANQKAADESSQAKKAADIVQSANASATSQNDLIQTLEQGKEGQ